MFEIPRPPMFFNQAREKKLTVSCGFLKLTIDIKELGQQLQTRQFWFSQVISRQK